MLYAGSLFKAELLPPAPHFWVRCRDGVGMGGLDAAVDKALPGASQDDSVRTEEPMIHRFVQEETSRLHGSLRHWLLRESQSLDDDTVGSRR